jgi:hypothetical protein
LLPIACLCVTGLAAFALARLGVVVAAVAIALLFVDLHVHLYRESAPGAPERVAFRDPGRMLELPIGWKVQRSAGPVLLFERSASDSVPLFCQGWYGDTRSGRYMSERHAPLWVFGRMVAAAIRAAAAASARPSARRTQTRLAPRHCRRPAPRAHPGPEESRRRKASRARDIAVRLCLDGRRPAQDTPAVTGGRWKRTRSAAKAGS